MIAVRVHYLVVAETMTCPHPAVQFSHELGVEFFPSVRDPNVRHTIPLHKFNKEDGHRHHLLVLNYLTFWSLAEVVLHNDDVTIPIFIFG